MIVVFDWLVAHWFVIFLLAFFGVFRGIRDFVVDTYNKIAKARSKRRIAEIEARTELERVRTQAVLAAASGAPRPGPCVHRDVVPVISAAEELVAWLCKCGTQLPRDWAVREEDL